MKFEMFCLNSYQYNKKKKSLQEHIVFSGSKTNVKKQKETKILSTKLIESFLFLVVIQKISVSPF